MTRSTHAAAVTAASLLLAAAAAPSAAAGLVASACQNAPRSAAAPELCACIQRVADQTLTRSDQRLAASFFEDPHQAQEIRMSDRRSHEDFWQRYKYFGSVANKVCS